MPHQSITRPCEHCSQPFTVTAGHAHQRFCSRDCGYAKRIAEGVARFWRNVDRSGGPAACWPWLAGRVESGYGQYHVARRPIGAHRYAYILTHGPIPDALCVCHSCDNPPCCNPAHHWLGTKGDNNRDTAAKGRTRQMSLDKRLRGASHGCARLTDSQVIAIRARHAAGGVFLHDIAAEFGISTSNVVMIVQRRTWRHLP